MTSWFESWFDTEYYHLLYKNRDYKEAELFMSTLVDKLQISFDQKVLDLACGKGRHSIYLNKQGLNVTGVDLSKASIASAKQFENERLQFFVHDMREEIKDRTFDYVLNLFTSIGYFENSADNIKMLNSIAKYINKDGVLVIDFMNAQKVLTTLIPYEEKQIEGITFKITKSVDNGFIIKDIRFEDEGENFHFQEKVEAITLRDFEKMFEQTDFSIIQTFGDYELSDFNVDNSNRLIIFAKK